MPNTSIIVVGQNRSFFSGHINFFVFRLKQPSPVKWRSIFGSLTFLYILCYISGMPSSLRGFCGPPGHLGGCSGARYPVNGGVVVDGGP